MYTMVYNVALTSDNTECDRIVMQIHSIHDQNFRFSQEPIDEVVAPGGFVFYVDIRE